MGGGVDVQDDNESSRSTGKEKPRRKSEGLARKKQKKTKPRPKRRSEPSTLDPETQQWLAEDAEDERSTRAFPACCISTQSKTKNSSCFVLTSCSGSCDPIIDFAAPVTCDLIVSLK